MIQRARTRSAAASGTVDERVFCPLHAAILRCDPSLRKGMCAKTVLSGGNTFFPGLSDRIAQEMRVLMPTAEVSVANAPSKECAAWVGGSILSSLSTFQQMWITPSEYSEYGPEVVHRKCV